MQYPISVPEVNLYAGKFTNGDPLLSIPRSIDRAEDMNRVYDELIAVVTGAGLTPSEADNTQLFQAINNLIKGGDYKASVRVATTAAINLAAPGANIDGVAMVVGDSFLDKDNATPALRGPYIWNGAAVPATRRLDADTGAELNGGAIIPVEEGTENADTNWQVTNNGTVTIGTTGLTFQQIGANPSISSRIQSIASSVAGNALTLNYNGGTLDFRNASLSNGVPVQNVVVLPNSITVPSGSTLGFVSGQQGFIALLEAYNGGSPVACVVNLAGGLQLDETNLISPTTISGASNASNVIYSASAVSANSPYRVVAIFAITEAIAGTWATDATLKQGMGGQAFAAMSSLGYGQTWQNVTGSRVAGTTYYNATGKPITVAITGYQTNAGWVNLTVNGILIGQQGAAIGGGNNVNLYTELSAIVPIGGSYVVAVSAASINNWSELR